MEDKNSLLVVSAHAADFVWRSGGTIAKYIKQGDKVNLIILSYGVRGESNDLWKIEGQTVDNVKKIRRGEIEEAASILGIKNMEIWDFQDYFMEITEERIYRLARRMREIRPYHIISHAFKDAFNPDHEAVANYVYQSNVLAIEHAAGVKMEGTTPIEQPRIFGFEPHQTEINDFKPDTIIDITETYPLKEAAMKCFKTQNDLFEYYGNRAKMRGNHARRISGNKAYKYAEAFTRLYPYVGSDLV